MKHLAELLCCFFASMAGGYIASVWVHGFVRAWMTGPLVIMALPLSLVAYTMTRHLGAKLAPRLCTAISVSAVASFLVASFFLIAMIGV